MIKALKKYDTIILFILIVLISFGIEMSMPIKSGDELWNFNNAYKIYNGYKIYKDTNVIITPIFFYIVEIFFYILGANYLVFRLIGIISYAILVILIYKIFKEMGIGKKIAFFYVIILHQTIYYIQLCAANYNCFAIIFSLLGILKALKNKNSWVWQGIIIFLVLFTKQNIGVLYFIAICLSDIIINGINKKSIKKIIKQSALATALSLVLLLIMYCQGILADFLSFAVFGLKEFSGNFYIDIYIISLLSFIIVIWTLTTVVRKKGLLEEQTNKKLMILCIFSTLYVFITYPIANSHHIILGSIITYITVICILHLIGINVLKLEKLIIIIGILFLIKSVGNSAYNTYKWIKKADFTISNNNPYFGCRLLQKEKIEKMDKFIIEKNIEGKEVIILSHQAGLYLIPLQKNNGVFDLPFKGNLGKEGENGLIDKISKLKSCVILITKGNLFWQESEKANEFVRNNFRKIGEIEGYEIYE